jgi:ABC-type multidrug transport system ATPase subunit
MLIVEHLNDEATISCYKISKKINDGFVVKDISFQVGQGEIFGIIGPSGAGKSTIFNMFSLYSDRDSG